MMWLEKVSGQKAENKGKQKKAFPHLDRRHNQLVVAAPDCPAQQ